MKVLEASASEVKLLVGDAVLIFRPHDGEATCVFGEGDVSPAVFEEAREFARQILLDHALRARRALELRATRARRRAREPQQLWLTFGQ